MTELNKPCQICDNTFFSKTKYLNKYGHLLFDGKAIFICQRCGFGQMYPKIEKNNLIEFYKNYYRSKTSPAFIDFKSWALSKNVLQPSSISQLLLGVQFLANKGVYSFMDIGPGIGWSFVSIKNILDKVKLFTIELSSEAKKFYLNNLEKIKIFESFDEIEEKMDIILMSHSLEHFDIDEFNNLFLNIHRVLVDDGIVIIEVPHELGYENRVNDTPHISFFSPESLKKLVGKYESEFELCFIDTVGPLLSEANKSKIKFYKNINHNKVNLISQLKSLIKKIVLNFGLYDFYRMSKHMVKIDEFFSASDFKYGGDRANIRCVLKKRPLTI